MCQALSWALGTQQGQNRHKPLPAVKRDETEQKKGLEIKKKTADDVQ